MRFKFGIRAVAWSAVSFPALVLVALCAGCDSGGGGAASPEEKQTVQAQQDTAKKIVDETNAAAAKKGGGQVKFGGKPGAAGGK